MSQLLKILLMLALVALPSYGGWIVWSEKIAPAPEPDRAPGRAPASSSLSELRYVPRENTRYTYGFRRKIVFRGLNIPDIKLSGEFHVDVLRSDAKGFTAVWSEQVKEFPSADVRLFARFDVSAKKIELKSGPLRNDGDRQHANVMKDLISLWAYPLEQDTLGAYRASYEQKDGERKKTKLTYLDAGAPSIFNSEHWLTWDDALGLPSNLHGEERTHHASGAMPLTTETEYKIDFLGKSAIPAEPPVAWGKAETLSLVPMQEALDPAELGVTWEKTRTELLGLGSLSNSEKLRVFGDLVKLLRAGKVTAMELRELLGRDAIRLGSLSPLFQSVVGALATAGGPENFAALRAIYADPDCPVSGKGSVQAALTTTEAPIDAPTRDFLAEAMRVEQNRELANGAAYALGSALQRAPDDASSRSAIADIHSAWAAAGGNVPAQLSLLDVMGNSGRLEFLPSIRGAMDTRNDPSVQAKAVFSLRYVDSMEANALLAAQLANPNPPLREAAIEAVRMGTWRESYRPALETCASSDPVEKLRTACGAALVQSSGKLANTH